MSSKMTPFLLIQTTLSSSPILVIVIKNKI